jgi:lysine 2,3-aminomutase
MSNRWQQCWDSEPEIHILLKESDNLETAREKLINYISALDWSYRRDIDKIKSWDYILLKEAVRCFNNIISPRNERLSGTSALEYLWKAAQKGDSEVEDDFIFEFLHLFKAIKGHSDVYPSKIMGSTEPSDYDEYRGREAAQKRSDFLDDMGRQMNKYLKRYPSGLDPDVVKRRIENRKRILELLGGTQDDWDSWKWQFRNVFTGKDALNQIKQIIKLKEDQEEAINLTIENDVPFGVTPHYLHLMDPEPSDYDFAVRRQVFPPLSYVKNMIEHKGDRDVAFDFMREHDTSPVDLVTRRYPTVAIIKPYDSCPQICVYCQRNWEITSPFMESAQASKESIDKAIDWYAEHDQIMDILITGGDPLVMSNKMIEHIVKRLSELQHMKSIRIATRIPITVPQRITDELCETFAAYHEIGKRILCVVTHASHSYELTNETAESIKKVRKHGIYVYNQQVYTFGNSRRFETAALRIAEKQMGIDPYYTFNMKGKSEIEDYAVPVARILQERKEEARLLPGIFRTDEPVFNVPFLGKNHLRAWQDHELIAIQPNGSRMYSFHPWEKNIDQIKPYLYTDIPIKDYLDKLKERGEDPEEYNSIWYYY